MIKLTVRIFNRMDEDALMQFDNIDKSLRDIICSIKCPEHVLLDLNSTSFGTYGSQEGEYTFLYKIKKVRHFHKINRIYSGGGQD